MNTTLSSLWALKTTLIVQDPVAYAKIMVYIGPGRGSSSASLVSYILNITEVDPLEYNLLFERF